MFGRMATIASGGFAINNRNDWRALPNVTSSNELLSACGSLRSNGERSRGSWRGETVRREGGRKGEIEKERYMIHDELAIDRTRTINVESRAPLSRLRYLDRKKNKRYKNIYIYLYGVYNARVCTCVCAHALMCAYICVCISLIFFFASPSVPLVSPTHAYFVLRLLLSHSCPCTRAFASVNIK